jgi:hypothetical protein
MISGEATHTNFKWKRFLEIDQSETRIACGGHFCYWISEK